jgi:hypothetical protein
MPALKKIKNRVVGWFQASALEFNLMERLCFFLFRESVFVCWVLIGASGF